MWLKIEVIRKTTHSFPLQMPVVEIFLVLSNWPSLLRLSRNSISEIIIRPGQTTLISCSVYADVKSCTRTSHYLKVNFQEKHINLGIFNLQDECIKYPIFIAVLSSSRCYCSIEHVLNYSRREGWRVWWRCIGWGSSWACEDRACARAWGPSDLHTLSLSGLLWIHAHHKEPCHPPHRK